MNPRIGFILAVIMAVCPSASSAQDLDFLVKQAKGQVKVHRDNAGNADSEGWFEAQSTEGHFRVRFPERFVDYTELKPEKSGRMRSVFALQTTNSAPFDCSVTESITDPDVPPIRMLHEAARDAIAKTITDMPSRKEGVHVLDVRKFDFNGFPAVDSRLQIREVLSISRNIFTPGRVYVLNVKCPVESHGEVSPQAKKIFDSFQFDPPRQADYASAEEEKRLLLEYVFKVQKSGKLKTAEKDAAPAPQ